MKAPNARPHAAWGFRVAVVIVVVVALAVAGFGVWQLWGVGHQAAAKAGDAGDAYLASCPADASSNGQPSPTLPAPLPLTSAPPEGSIIGLLTLPGSSTTWPIKVGTGDDSLDAGVGWYPQTASPGQIGNMAVVGRRLPSGGAFDSILSLSTGDQVVVETCTMRYTYTISVAPRDLTVQPDATWVLGAVPGQPSVVPTTSWLTLIANQDVLPSSDRAVGFAKLSDAVLR